MVGGAGSNAAAEALVGQRAPDVSPFVESAATAATATTSERRARTTTTTTTTITTTTITIERRARTGHTHRRSDRRDDLAPGFRQDRPADTDRFLSVVLTCVRAGWRRA